MPFHEVTVTDSVHFTARELGELFCELDAEQMVEFWEEVARTTSSWKRDVSFQWQAFSDALTQAEKDFESKARKPLSSLLEYIK